MNGMKKASKPVAPLAIGQMWKVEDRYIHIVDMGKQLIHYKILRQKNQRGVLTRMVKAETLQDYLRTNAAVLGG
jgi:hypothetical protein